MGRQRNNCKSKGNEEFPEEEINEVEARNLSDIEFKIMVIRMFKELGERDKELYGSYKKLSGNYSNMKKDTESKNKSHDK